MYGMSRVGAGGAGRGGGSERDGKFVLREPGGVANVSNLRNFEG